jgi:hypothetical protein
VPSLLLGLQDVQWAVGNSRGARKLAWTPHVNQKKKKIVNIKNDDMILMLGFLKYIYTVKKINLKFFGSFKILLDKSRVI